METSYKIALFFHLVGFAAYTGAWFAETRLLAASARAGVDAAVRDAYERLAARIVTLLELPGIMVSIASGIAFLVMTGFPKDGKFHTKLTAVLILLALSHLQMFNAKKIVRARAGGGADAEIEARKARHAAFAAIGAVVLFALVAIVVLRRW